MYESKPMVVRIVSPLACSRILNLDIITDFVNTVGYRLLTERSLIPLIWLLIFVQRKVGKKAHRSSDHLGCYAANV